MKKSLQKNNSRSQVFSYSFYSSELKFQPAGFSSTSFPGPGWPGYLQPGETTLRPAQHFWSLGSLSFSCPLGRGISESQSGS